MIVNLYEDISTYFHSMQATSCYHNSHLTVNEQFPNLQNICVLHQNENIEHLIAMSYH